MSIHQAYIYTQNWHTSIIVLDCHDFCIIIIECPETCALAFRVPILSALWTFITFYFSQSFQFIVENYSVIAATVNSPKLFVDIRHKLRRENGHLTTNFQQKHAV